MKFRFVKRGGSFGSLLLILLTCTMQAQVQVSIAGKIGTISERMVEAGEKYFEEIAVLNRGEAVEIMLFKKDLFMDLGKIIIKDAETVGRSNSSWIQIEHSRMLLKARSKVTIKIPIQVPKEVDPGSYFSMLILATAPSQGEQKRIKIGVQTAFSFQLISTIFGGRKGVKVVNAQVDNESDKLVLDLQNTGTNLLIVDVIPREPGIESRRLLLYPGMTSRTKLDVKELRDGDFKNVRILLDDPKRNFLQSIKINFFKGVELLIEEAPLHLLQSERLEERKRKNRKPLRIYLVANYGSYNRGLSLAGSYKIGNLSLSAGSVYMESFSLDMPVKTYRATASYKISKWLQVSAGGYHYWNRWSRSARARISFKNFSAGINYLYDTKSWGINFSQRFFNKFNVSFHGFKSEFRESWNLSVRIPII